MSALALKAQRAEPGTARARRAADLLALLTLPRVGAKTAVRAALVEGEFEALVDRHEASWSAALARAHDVLEDCRQQGIEALGLFDEDYPRRLLAIHDPPPLLFVRGSIDALHDERMVAVVGTREPTRDGRAATEQFTYALARAGWGIVSGLAKGVDTLAHRGALEQRASTVAVMAGGLDRIYPRENVELAAAIVESGGALIAEVPPGVTPRRSHFVARDRLQSALAVAVVVAQTGIEGGTMHTVRYAAAQGRPVFCARPACEDEQSLGLSVLLKSSASELCNELPAWADARRLCLRLGAQPLGRAVSPHDLDDMIEDLEFALNSQQPPQEPRAGRSTEDACFVEGGDEDGGLVYAFEPFGQEQPSLFARVDGDGGRLDNELV
jgi:DNA processing protein